MRKGFNGSIVPRFQSVGLHPDHLKNGITNDRAISANLGPGSYDVKDGSRCSTTKNNKEELQSDWRRALYLKEQSLIPYFLNKNIYMDKIEKKRNLGPGKYEIVKDVNHHNSASAMRSRSCRFRKRVGESFPGPGTYGKLGIPDQNLYEANQRRKYCNTVGLLSRGGKSEREFYQKSYSVGPGIYQIKSAVAESLNKKTGKRNFYDCSTGPRSGPIKTGHYAIWPAHDVAPGTYQHKEFIRELNDKFHKFKGKFLKQPRNLRRPHERVFYEDPANVPVDEDYQVSPASYDPRSTRLLKCARVQGKKHPFDLSTARMDSVALANFTGNNNSYTGPGRYNIEGHEMRGFIPGAESSFKSTYKTFENNEKYLSVRERIRPVNILADPANKISHHATELSACLSNEFVLKNNIKLH